ncbi:MAG: carbohydrate ABC transporter permease [Chloroflexi bacterium]|nr:carbohydrate ABC transporter permease [Chloroflexota bacterium]
MRETLSAGAVLVLLLLFGLSFTLPLFWMASTSLKTNEQLVSLQPVWIPNPLNWVNYVRAIDSMNFLQQTRNTLTVCFLALTGQVISSSLAGYGFSRLQWPGREVVFVLVLTTMMLPGQVTMIPLFIIFRNLRWINTLKPLFVPSMLGSAFYIFLFRQFFLALPSELNDAARIDGCSELGIYWRIILPLSKPVIATVALFTFLSHWNDFQGPLIYLQSADRYTLSLGLQVFSGRSSRDMTALMAATTLVSLPAIVLFFFTQRTFIQGIALTGLKA